MMDDGWHAFVVRCCRPTNKPVASSWCFVRLFVVLATTDDSAGRTNTGKKHQPWMNAAFFVKSFRSRVFRISFRDTLFSPPHTSTNWLVDEIPILVIIVWLVWNIFDSSHYVVVPTFFYLNLTYICYAITGQLTSFLFIHGDKLLHRRWVNHVHSVAERNSRCSTLAFSLGSMVAVAHRAVGSTSSVCRARSVCCVFTCAYWLTDAIN